MINALFTGIANAVGINPLIVEIILIALTLTGGAIGYGVWHHEVYEQGVKDTIAGIAREDKKLIDRAIDARAKWQECTTQGGNWDQTTGRCH